MDLSNQMIESLDKERALSDKRVKEALEQGEIILLSCRVLKFNNVNKQQKRLLVITDRNIYNARPSFFITNVIAKIYKKIRIKRKIPISSIYGVTVSRLSKEFAIHVPTEYDYRFSSKDFREQILETICQCFCKINQRQMPFFYKDDFMLIDYTTTKDDSPKLIQRMPKDKPQLLDVESFRKLDKSFQADIIYNQIDYKSKSDSNFTLTNPLVSMTEFQPIKVLGRGAFGKVMLCQHLKNNQFYAIKTLNKENLIKSDQIVHTVTERNLLTLIDHVFLVKLIYAFQTPQKIFFVMPFIRGGELFQQLKIKDKFQEMDVLFYITQLVLGLEYIHSLGYVYRDVKPENIMIAEDGYIKLTDFGLSKKLIPGQRTFTFVGTPDYIAPEIITHQGHDQMVDWWSVGILTYELLIGLTPFTHEKEETMFYMIKNKDVKFPDSSKISNMVKDLIQQLLNRDPLKRLGSQNGANQIFQHPWFQQISIPDLMKKSIKPPFVPILSDLKDVHNFDEQFTNEDPIFSHIQGDKNLLHKYENQFRGMSFINDD